MKHVEEQGKKMFAEAQQQSQETYQQHLQQQHALQVMAAQAATLPKAKCVEFVRLGMKRSGPPFKRVWWAVGDAPSQGKPDREPTKHHKDVLLKFVQSACFEFGTEEWCKNFFVMIPKPPPGAPLPRPPQPIMRQMEQSCAQSTSSSSGRLLFMQEHVTRRLHDRAALLSDDDLRRLGQFRFREQQVELEFLLVAAAEKLNGQQCNVHAGSDDRFWGKARPQDIVPTKEEAAQGARPIPRPGREFRPSGAMCFATPFTAPAGSGGYVSNPDPIPSFGPAAASLAGAPLPMISPELRRAMAGQSEGARLTGFTTALI